MKLKRLTIILNDCYELNKDKNFCQFIRIMRKASGLTRVAAAMFAGMSDKSFAHIESNKIRKPIRDEYLIGLSEVFGVEYEFLKKKMMEFCDDGNRGY